MHRIAMVLMLVPLAALGSAGTAGAQTSHKLWPRINGVLLMNKTDSSRPLDARPGHARSAAATPATRAAPCTSAATASGAS